MKEKIALITGATDGIGKETALGILRTSSNRVVIVGRDPAKTASVVASMSADFGSQRVEGLTADLSRMAEVRKVAEHFSERFGELQVLVNNVGAVNLVRKTTTEGLEETFALNHLGVFLLTKLLMPALERGAPSRVVTVSSGAHRRGFIDFNDLQSKEKYSAMLVYARSKLMNILFTRELARRVQGKGITANALHPGLVASNFMRKPGVIGALGGLYFRFRGKPPQKGALTSIYLATAAEVAGVTGKYFVNCIEAVPSPQAMDDAAAKQLWDISEDLITAAG